MLVYTSIEYDKKLGRAKQLSSFTSNQHTTCWSSEYQFCICTFIWVVYTIVCWKI